MVRSESSSPSALTAATRLQVVDDAKGALIVLVVLGHFLATFSGWEDASAKHALAAIYLFHMPGFVFLAGITATLERRIRRACSLILILVTFQILYAAPHVVLEGAYPTDILRPFWILWFLLSLVFWNLSLPLIERVKGALWWSSALAIACGLLSFLDYRLSAGRTFAFLPFFVWGYLHGRKTLEVVSRVGFSAKPLLLFLLALAGWGFSLSDLNHRWLHGALGFNTLNAAPVAGLLIRLLLLVVSGVCLLAFLGVIGGQKRSGLLSMIGRRSLAIYLFHGFFVIVINKVSSGVEMGSGSLFMISISATAFTVAILAHPWWTILVKDYSERVTTYIWDNVRLSIRHVYGRAGGLDR